MIYVEKEIRIAFLTALLAAAIIAALAGCGKDDAPVVVEPAEPSVEAVLPPDTEPEESEELVTCRKKKREKR